MLPAKKGQGPRVGANKMTRLRRDRRARGYCAEPGCREKTGSDFRCEAHAQAYAARNKLWRLRRDQRKRLEARGAAGAGSY